MHVGSGFVGLGGTAHNAVSVSVTITWRLSQVLLVRVSVLVTQDVVAAGVTVFEMNSVEDGIVYVVLAFKAVVTQTVEGTVMAGGC